MKVNEWRSKLERLAPLSYSCQWDNPGLLAGRGEKEVSKILIALDATDEVVDLAETKKADLLLTHHPLIFKPVKTVNDQDFIGRRLIKMIQADISCYAMHTNFDIAPGWMGDLAAEKLGLLDSIPLEVTGEKDGCFYGIGKVGNLAKEISLKSLAQEVKAIFGLPFVTLYGAKQAEKRIKRVAVCPGSGKGMTDSAINLGAQVLITGDMGHHDGIDAEARGLVILDGGHYGLEHMFVDFMEQYCRQVDGNVEVIKAPVEFPVASW